MKNELLKISLRQQAIYIPKEAIINTTENITETTSVFVANAASLGFAISEPLLYALNGTNQTIKLAILDNLKEVLGTHKNWTPLVKGWDVPTGESIIDHIVTYLANIFKSNNGKTLPCGHLIPENTFPLERYNGCPFCGKPFEFGELEFSGQASKLKVLDLWSELEMQAFYIQLLKSKTALDATQVDSLKILLENVPFPDSEIGIKETLMVIIDHFVSKGKPDQVQKYFQTPTDILRYLWFKKTGFLQIVEPKTIIKRTGKNNIHFHQASDTSIKSTLDKKSALKLKYNRKECLVVAKWMNNLPMEVEQCCETMHPKRGMWVRFIRALRLPEYSKAKGFEKLARILDVFYNQSYTVWQGEVNHYRLRADADKTFSLLKQRPGLFARSLFANMLWFGPEETIRAFSEVIDKVPARLVFTLNMYAKNYFNSEQHRSVKPLGGTTKRIPSNRFLSIYTKEQLAAMISQIEVLSIELIERRFAKIENANKSMYIEPALFYMPVAIGDRSESVQDLPVALMGTRFKVEGEKIRLFMQWGMGLPSQHLDMDLSCQIAFDNKTEFCSFGNLVATGCKHSGDIRHIPNKIGTAEYIEIDVDELRKANARYVSFTCNAYSAGSISPDMVVGWMNSAYPMKVSGNTGVAFDPSCVQHQVRIAKNLSKGLVFGVLDVDRNEIVWLEISFGGQVVQNLNHKGVKSLLDKLESKLNIGALLTLKAKAQRLEIVQERETADEVYDFKWAINAAAVTQLFID